MAFGALRTIVKNMPSRALPDRNLLSMVERVAALSQAGTQPIAPEEERFLRGRGIYTQRPAADGFFMVRIHVPGGELTADQLRAIAMLSNRYGRELVDVTVRQNIQMHWVQAEDLTDLLLNLWAARLVTGDVCDGSVRNIITCPVAGIDEDELYDARHLARLANDLFTGNAEFAALPRKLKITITGCALRCSYPEVNDIGMFAVPDFEEGGISFRVRVGGGLSDKPRFSQDLGVLVRATEVVDLCRAIAVVFRGRETDRNGNRAHYVVEANEISAFRDEVALVLGRELRSAPKMGADSVAGRDRSHIGIHGQRINGFYYVGMSLVGGRSFGDQLARLADISEKLAGGRVRTTNTQNLVLPDIPEWNLVEAARELDGAGFDYEPNWSRKAVIACTGIQFCKQALAETKNRAEELADYLEDSIDMDDPVRISVTGCPNSCGQHHICDVGLEGSLTTVNGVKRESFQILLGGGVGEFETLSRRIGLHIPADRISEAVTRLFSRYQADRINEETFQEFCIRHSDEQLANFLLPSRTGRMAQEVQDFTASPVA